MAKSRQRFLWALSLGSVLSLFLGFGAYPQQLFVNGVLGQANSFYEALTPAGFVRPHSFLDWIDGFYSIWHLPLAIAICYLALKYQRIRPIFFSLFVGILVALTLVDTAHGIFIAEIRTSLPESYLSDVLGAPIIAIVICLILLYSHRFGEHLRILGQLPRAIIPLLIGGGVFLVIFIIVKNLFWVTDSSLSVLVKPPFQAEFGASSVDKSDDRFGVFLNNRIRLDKITWNGEFANMSLEVSHPTERAKIWVYLFGGCLSENTKQLLNLHNVPVMTGSAISHVGLQVNDGMGSFSVYSPNANNGHWNVSDEKVGIFSVKPSGKDDSLVVTVFSPEDAKFVHRGWRNETYYKIDASLIGKQGTQSRTIAVAVDGKKRIFTFSPNSGAPLDQRIKCRPAGGLGNHFSMESPISTVLLRIAYPPQMVKDLNVVHDTVIAGLNGFLVADGIRPVELHEFISNGKLSMLSMQGAFDELYVDDVKQQLRRQNWLYFQGGTVSGSADGEFLTFNGKTDVIAVDGTRVSKTHWEKIAPAIKWLLTLLLPALGYLLKVFLDAWKRNDVLYDNRLAE